MRGARYADKMKAAAEYIRYGWPVVVLHGIGPDGKCTCKKADCPSPGKHPLTRNGVKDAAINLDKITRLLKKHRHANIGIATGGESGPTVVDEDPRNGGDKTRERLEAQHGSLPAGPRVRTGSGGMHYYGRGEEEIRCGAIGPGLERKGTGGYVVVPPSRHVSGKRYARETSPNGYLPVLPAWVLADAAGERKNLKPEDLLDGVDAGERNTTLASVVGRWVGKGLTRQEVLTLAVGFATGCAPPIDDAEVIKTVDSVFTTDARNHPSNNRPVRVYSARELMTTELPEPRWCVPKMLIEGMGLLVGKSKLGKSWLALDLGISVAQGGSFLGQRVERGEVLYLALEDSERRIKNRMAMLLGEGPPWPRRLHFAHDLSRLDQGGLTWISEWLDAHPDCRLVILDTWGRVRSPRKKDSDLYQYDVDQGVLLQHLGMDHHACVLGVHHRRKATSLEWLV